MNTIKNIWKLQEISFKIPSHQLLQRLFYFIILYEFYNVTDTWSILFLNLTFMEPCIVV